MPLLLFVEAIVVLFFGLVQLFSRKKRPLHYWMSIACLVMGYTLLYFWAVASKAIRQAPFLVGSDIALEFLAGPCLYLAGRSILSGGRPALRRPALYFLAVAPLALGAELYNLAIGPAYVKRFGLVPGHFATMMLSLLTLGAGLVIVAAILGALLHALHLRKSGEIPNEPEFRHQVAMLFCYLAAALVLLGAIALTSEELYAIGIALFGGIGLVYALSRTGTAYFPGMREPPPPRKRRTEWDAGAAELAARLERLMDDRAPYKDSAFSRSDLARLLDVEPERISYHLMATRSLSFSAYLNELRLEAVCRDLTARPLRSILETAFENGFNSKTRFNTLFVKKYGVTPRRYRSEHHREGATG